MQLSREAFRTLLPAVDVVSFDVFDTLLHRQLLKPSDIFTYIERTAGIPQFAKARSEAEAAVRKVDGRTDVREVSLDDIYEVLNQSLPGPDVDPIIELQAEASFVSANPAILPYYEEARAAGKKIIAITDMYLSGEQVTGLLDEAGMSVDHVYSSSDFRQEGLGKFNGRIFPRVAAAEGADTSRLLHIGDNFNSDFVNARNAGAMALWVPKVQEIARVELDGFDRLIGSGTAGLSGSLVAGIIKSALFRSSQSALYEIGYRAGGPLLLGFVQFLLTSCARDGVTRLNLFARDGHVIARVMEALDISKPEYEVTAASRRMFIFPVATEDGIETWDTLSKDQPSLMTWQEFCKIISYPPEKLHPERDLFLKASFIDHWNSVEDSLKMLGAHERKMLLSYYEDRLHGPNGGSAGWVDVGWHLSSVKAVDALLDKELLGYFVGMRVGGYRRRGLSGYLFEPEEPKGLSTSLTRGLNLIELFFSDASPYAVRIVESAECLKAEHEAKDPEEIIRDAAVFEVRRGIMDFIHSAKPFLDGFDSHELREFNRLQMMGLVVSPTVREYEALSSVPHTRLAGRSSWEMIGDRWKPREMSSVSIMGDFFARRFAHNNRSRMGRRRKLKRAVLKLLNLVTLRRMTR